MVTKHCQLQVMITKIAQMKKKQQMKMQFTE